MSDFGPKGARNEKLHEGVDEIRSKLRQDMSRWAQARRSMTLKPTMGCMECDATGKVSCTTCAGTGASTLVIGQDEAQKCLTCGGAGQVTCVDCAGKGWVENVHRKKIKLILYIGLVAWLLVLLRLWMVDHDLLPGFRAEVKGRAVSAPAVQGGVTPVPGVPPPGNIPPPAGPP